MNLEAYRAGEYHSPGWNQAYPRIQILTIEELLNGKRPHVPARTLPYKQAGKVGPSVTQHRMDLPNE
jgi:site-specific DNA-methyltransferase (adenine-specific)